MKEMMSMAAVLARYGERVKVSRVEYIQGSAVGPGRAHAEGTGT